MLNALMQVFDQFSIDSFYLMMPPVSFYKMAFNILILNLTALYLGGERTLRPLTLL